MEPEDLEHILAGRKKPTKLQFSLLTNITENFSKEREIGKGGFATVYKGVLPNGNVAVKRIMNKHTIDDAPFYREVDILLAVDHPNIVKFVGYCASTELEANPQEGSKAHIYAEQKERLLCFEYVGNGSLQEHITDELRGLEWNTRYSIIKGICDGLDYLLNVKSIYHMDLKPANVLLDSNMVPKITDFGQSRYDEKSQTISMNRYGSRGYCPPEYALFGKRSPRSDVYSLGTIIIELVTGHREIPNNNKTNVLRRWRHRWRKTGMESPLSYQQVTKCLDIGVACQEIEPCNRPFIWEIVRGINEIEVTNMKISNDYESTVVKISPYSDDDMLGIEPLELHFPFGLNKEMSCSLELTNETDSYIAFEVKKTSPLPYCTEPYEGIIAPRFKWSVDITLQPQEKAPERASGFIVRSTRVNSGFTTEHIKAMFNNCTGTDVDEVNLDVIFDPEVIARSQLLLDVQPLKLCFDFQPNKLIACSLNLTNNTDEQVAFGLLKKSNDQTCFLSRLPMFGIVNPNTTYSIVVIMDKHKNLPQEGNVDLSLQSSTYYGIPGNREECMQHFRNAEKLGNIVHTVTLKGVCSVQGETIFEQSIPPSIKVISMGDNHAVQDYGIYSMDVNDIEPLIITGHSDGYVHMWNYDTQKSIGSINISNEDAAYSVKFIARKGWFLVGMNDGIIHVYSYEKKIQEITSFKAGSYVHALAIHPTKSYVLSASDTGIKLWDWDHGWFGWKCIQTLKADLDVDVVAFNPANYNSFASASDDKTIKVWSIDPPKFQYALSGHLKTVFCMEFFTRGDGQQYLITGSDDNTAKIWDMQKKECVRTLPHNSEVRSVLPHPRLRVLVTGTFDGHVHLWSSIDFRLERIIRIGERARVLGLACLMESRRVAIAHDEGVSVIEIPEGE